MSAFRTSLISTHADRQTQRASRKQNELVFQSYGRPIPLMADRCYLGIATRKSVLCCFNILDKQRTPYKPVTNKEAQNKGWIHNRVSNVIEKSIVYGTYMVHHRTQYFQNYEV